MCFVVRPAVALETTEKYLGPILVRPLVRSCDPERARDGVRKAAAATSPKKNDTAQGRAQGTYFGKLPYIYRYIDLTPRRTNTRPLCL